VSLLNSSLLVTCDVVEYCYFFAKHSLNSISLEIVNKHALSYVLVQVNAPLVRVKLV